MNYADGRTIHDADSHVMELPDWLESYADPAMRDRIRPLQLGKAGKAAQKAVDAAAQRRDHSDGIVAAEEQLMTAKGWGALGAFDAGERSRALDLLGFESQLVFSTFAGTQYAGLDPEVVEGGLRAHNRAMAEFCSDDARLLAVAAIQWLDPDVVVRLAEEAIDGGCAALMVPSHPGNGISPTHPDHDRLWSLLEESGVPFVTHIGGEGRTLKAAFHNNGRQVSDWLGGGENLRGKDYMVISQQPEQFMSAMILDGVLEDHPGLRGGCIEQGAMWVVPWLRRLDLAQRSFGRSEPTIASLPERASDYVHRQLFFTPFPREDVGWMIDQCGEDLFMFSSDYPHPEGTIDPISRFEDTMLEVSDQARAKFYAGNYARLLGDAMVTA